MKRVGLINNVSQFRERVIERLLVLSRLLTPLLFALFPEWGYAKGDKTSSDHLAASNTLVQPSDYFLQILLSLILVLVVIFLAAFLLRRYAHVNGTLNGQLKVLGGMSLGQREKVVLVQVGKQQLLLGVTTSKISLLHTLDEPVETEGLQTSGTAPEAVLKKHSFAQRFQKALKKGASKQPPSNAD